MATSSGARVEQERRERSRRAGVWAAIAVGIALVVGGGEARAEVAVVRMSELAATLGLKRQAVHALAGLTRYGDGQNLLVLVPGAPEVLVNGQPLTLSRPVTCFQGDLLIPRDAAREIGLRIRPKPAPAPKPLVTPRPAARPGRVAAKRATPKPRAAVLGPPRGLIVLDPGHGGKFTGAKGVRGTLEKQINLAIVLHMRSLLQQRGWKVLLTRSRDRPMRSQLNADLESRIGLAHARRADLFVSVHANRAEDRGVSGFEVYHYASSTRSRSLARAVHRSMKGRIDDTDRGVKTARFRVLRLARLPAALVEVGFVSNRRSERRLATDAYRRRLATAIVEGIEQYWARQR